MSLFGLIIVSCNPIYYRPNPQQVPLFKEKGEIRASVVSNLDDQVDVQGAYAITNNIGIIANGVYAKKNMNNGIDGVTGSLFEFGAGYFTPLSSDFVFEIYGTAGIGYVHNKFGEPTLPIFDRTIESNLFRVGILPVIGFRKRNYVIAFFSRLAYLCFYNYKGGYIYDNEFQLTYLNDNKSNLLFEPALTVRGGWEKVQIQGQVVSSVNLSNAQFYQDGGYVSLGVIILINALSKSTEK